MSLGVIVGRFQVPYLHVGHAHLIETALANHEQVLIILGDHGGLPTSTNPIPYHLREVMIRAQYPTVVIDRLGDTPSDDLWIKRLDLLVQKHAEGNDAVLYGSRDSFLRVYTGRFATKEVRELPEQSGTLVRCQDESKNFANPLFLKGLAYAQRERPAVSYQAVDVAILNERGTHVLLGQKKIDGDKWRFIGRFVEPTDTSLEHTARREVSEEAGGIEITDPRYIGSFRIDDFRYRSGRDKILSSFFIAKFMFGRIASGDDLDNIGWQAITDLPNLIAPAHTKLAETLTTHLNNRSLS